MISEPVYLDFNATTPLHPEIRTHLGHWAQHWGNPSSIHWAGRKPKELLRDARKSIANLISAKPLEVIFTGGGSESNNMALKGLFYNSNKKHILRTDIEHPSIIETCNYLENLGAEVEVIPVTEDGVDFDSYSKLLRPGQTAFVTAMYANNETGMILPIKKMAREAHKTGAFFHCDAVQALGKVPLNISALGVDSASFSAHKFYALKGVGALYLTKETPWVSLIHGGGQERARRAGTENILGITSFGYMASLKDQVINKGEQISSLRDKIETFAKNEIGNVKINGESCSRVPNTSSICFHGVDSEALLINLDLAGFAVSAGAACSSGRSEPSFGLQALGLSKESARCTLRISLGWTTTEEQIKLFLKTLKGSVNRLRGLDHPGAQAHV